MAPLPCYLLRSLCLTGLFLFSSCRLIAPPKQLSSSPPTLLLGQWVDDYNSRYTITAETWTHHPQSHYEVIAWHPEQGFVIAQNAEDNPGEAGLYTRIDWMPLSNMDPYTWAFCLSTYDAPSAEAAQAVTIANRETPRTGCNGFPFSRMRRLTDG